MANITQIVNTDKNLKTLKKGLHYSDLDQLLSSSGPFTFFAPSDIAFEKEGNNYMEDLLTAANKPALTDCCKYRFAGKAIRRRHAMDHGSRNTRSAYYDQSLAINLSHSSSGSALSTPATA